MNEEYISKCLGTLTKERLLKIANRVGISEVNDSTSKAVKIQMILAKTTAKFRTMLAAFQLKELQNFAKKLVKETHGKKIDLIERILLSAGTWDFFVSYAAMDFDAYKAACDALGEKHRIWLDKKEVKPGDNILESIRKGIIESFVAVKFIRDNHNERQYTRYELELLNKFSKPKIPVVSNDRKSAIHRYFDNVHYFLWKGNSDEFLKEAERMYTMRNWLNPLRCNP